MGKNAGSKILVILTVIILSLLTTLVVVNNKKDSSDENKTTGKLVQIENQPTIGKNDAPVTVVEFGDFKCPACKVWGEQIFPQLVTDYVETGKVKFSYINVLFHGDESKLASLAAESIFKNSPDEYWNFHKELFKEQPSNDSVWITPKTIYSIAEKFPSIDIKKLESAITEETLIEEVNNDMKLVEEFNINQTPTIFIGNTIVEDPFNYESLKEIIENELEEQ